MGTGRGGDLSTLCHNYGLACQQWELKTFPGNDSAPRMGQSGYLFLGKFAGKYLTISSCYSLIPVRYISSEG